VTAIAVGARLYYAVSVYWIVPLRPLIFERLAGIWAVMVAPVSDQQPPTAADPEARVTVPERVAPAVLSPPDSVVVPVPAVGVVVVLLVPTHGEMLAAVTATALPTMVSLVKGSSPLAQPATTQRSVIANVRLCELVGAVSVKVVAPTAMPVTVLPGTRDVPREMSAGTDPMAAVPVVVVAVMHCTPPPLVHTPGVMVAPAGITLIETRAPSARVEARIPWTAARRARLLQIPVMAVSLSKLLG
jgi:hypothetical protein